MSPRGGWCIAVDTGGTFTDCVAVAPDGTPHQLKVLSSSALRGRVLRRVDARRAVVEIFAPRLAAVRGPLLAGCSFRGLPGGQPVGVSAWQPDTALLELAEEWPAGCSPGSSFELQSLEPAPLFACRLLTGTPQGEPLPPLELRLATTRGTNALLERRGAAVALFVTRGFGDLLTIGTQERPELFARTVRRPPPLYRAVVEVPERLAADGAVLEPLDLAALAAEVERVRGLGIDSAAVALLHSYLQPEHENQLAAFLRRQGFRHVVTSAELAARIRYVPRAATAVVEAYLAPVVGEFLAAVSASLPPPPAGSFLALTSAGGLLAAADFRACDSLLSGPAGGVVGALAAARASGFSRLVSFDMGGTSTDVARCDGAVEYVFEQRVGETRLLAPAVAVETVAAGGGSRVALVGGRLAVGPESAGATPGPACYGAGGPLTVTDLHLLLGRLVTGQFGVPLDVAAAERARDGLFAAVEEVEGTLTAPEVFLEGCLAIADERMADAIRQISVRRGYDPRGDVLVAFGGAGGLHACAVAERLGMSTVLLPPEAGVLSARGLAGATVERFAERQVLAPLAAMLPRLAEELAELAAGAAQQVRAAAGAGARLEVRRQLAFLRLRGQETVVPLELAAPPFDLLLQQFAARYRELYGYPPPEREIELESLRVVVAVAAAPRIAPVGGAAPHPARPESHQQVWLERWREVPVFARHRLAPGAFQAGPALMWEAGATTVVPRGWTFQVDAAAGIVLTRGAQR